MGLIARIRHTIAGEPSVTTTGSLHSLSDAEVTGGTLTPFETEAAVTAGNAVRAEVRRH
jgi:hypothetical protein